MPRKTPPIQQESAEPEKVIASPNRKSDNKPPKKVLFPNLSLNDVFARPEDKKSRKRGPMKWKSEESRQRQLAALRPCKPGETRNPGGRVRVRPFHEAAREIAESNLEELGITPDDTVARAIVKRLGHKALMMADVPAAKEFADRAEGAPQVLRTDGDEGEGIVNTSVGELLVRFGVQLSVKSSES